MNNFNQKKITKYKLSSNLVADKSHIVPFFNICNGCHVMET